MTMKMGKECSGCGAIIVVDVEACPLCGRKLDG